MARRDLSRDSTDHAANELQYVLKKTAKKTGDDAVPTVSVEQAMQEDRVVKHDTGRDITRVLFISQNIELLNPTKQTLDGYLDISDVFDEVHILVLRRGIKTTQPVLRPQKNVWIYTASTRHWWQMPGRGKELLRAQLAFADGFRPDLIVARDPFESALVALWAQKTFSKPAQLHILQNFYAPTFNKQASWNWLRKLIARYTIPKFPSVRTATERIHTRLTKQFSALPDVKRLPQLNPYESIAQIRQTLDLKKKYPGHVFNLLFVGTDPQGAAALQVVDAARFMLLNRRVGMIMIGPGPIRAGCPKRAKLLGIEKQMVFEGGQVDVPQYLKAADLLIVTDVDPASEELTLQAAGAGIPMVMVETETREDVFSHHESAYIIPPNDVQALADGIHALMNNFTERKFMAEHARQVIIDTFHQDPEEYRKVYRDSIEAVLFVEDTTQSEKTS